MEATQIFSHLRVSNSFSLSLVHGWLHRSQGAISFLLSGCLPARLTYQSSAEPLHLWGSKKPLPSRTGSPASLALCSAHAQLLPICTDYILPMINYFCHGFLFSFSPLDCKTEWCLVIRTSLSLCVCKDRGCCPLTTTSTDLEALQNCVTARQPLHSAVPWLPRAHFLPDIKYAVLHVLLLATTPSPILVIYICAINGLLKSELITIGPRLSASFIASKVHWHSSI